STGDASANAAAATKCVAWFPIGCPARSVAPLIGSAAKPGDCHSKGSKTLQTKIDGNRVFSREQACSEGLGWNLRGRLRDENGARPAAPRARRSHETWGECYGKSPDSSGRRQWHCACGPEFRGGDTGVQVCEQSRRGDRHGPKRSQSRVRMHQMLE